MALFLNPSFLFVAIRILSTESRIGLFYQTPNLETAKPGWLASLEKHNLLSRMGLEKQEKLSVEFYVASVSIFYFMAMYWEAHFMKSKMCPIC